jgi:Sulfotransferase family
MAVPQTNLSPWLVKQALRVNLDHGVIYLNNPKAGCTTVKTGLWLALQGKAPPPGSPQVHKTDNTPLSKSLTDADAARRAFVFTFVRNPLQRLVSAYLDKVVARRDSIWTEFATRHGADPVQAPGFDGFVEVLSGVAPELQNPHWRAQHLNILYPFVRPNLVADLGALRRELPAVLGRVSTRQVAEIPPSPHHMGAAAVWTDYYLRRAVDLYPGDFDAFSYAPSLTADPGGTMGVVRSDHAHEGLARMVDLFNVQGPKRARELTALEAADGDGTLSDWILAQRLRAPFHHQTTRQQLLRDHAAQIAAGPAYLRRIAEGD